MKQKEIEKGQDQRDIELKAESRHQDRLRGEVPKHIQESMIWILLKDHRRNQGTHIENHLRCKNTQLEDHRQ